jgi:hypothetical protein
MKLRVKEPLRETEPAERGLLIHLAENAQDRVLISTILDQTDLNYSIHQRIFVSILEVSVDAHGDCIGDVQEILTSRGDEEAATYLLSLTTAERSHSWAEAVALACHIALLGALRRAVEDNDVPVEENLW